MFRSNSTKFLTVLSFVIVFASFDVHAAHVALEAFMRQKTAEELELADNLLLAVAKNDFLKVYNLIAADADVNVKNIHGDAPLHFADADEIIQQLIAAGADVNVKDRNNSTPLHFARTDGKVKQLIAAKADVNARNQYGTTPLHVARTDGIVQQLIAAGADMNARDTYGNAPLHFADADEIVQQLIAAGADVNVEDINGDTPLHVARTDEKVKQLIAAGADVNARNHTGQTPLHCLHADGMVRKLISARADVNVRDNTGKTPLHVAARRLKSDLVRILADNGAEVTAVNADGQNISGIAYESANWLGNYSFGLDDQNIQKIDKIYNHHLNLNQSPASVAERKTLFGQTVMHAFDHYDYDGDPALLATYFGLDKSVKILKSVVERAKNMFAQDENGEPVIMDKLRTDYAAHVAAQNVAKTAEAPKEMSEEVR